MIQKKGGTELLKIFECVFFQFLRVFHGCVQLNRLWCVSNKSEYFEFRNCIIVWRCIVGFFNVKKTVLCLIKDLFLMGNLIFFSP